MNSETDPAAPDEAIEQLREKILAEQPRLGLNDKFTFGCHPGVSCFNHCCADVNIFLSPYDVLRLKKRLGMESSEFLDKYAILPVQKNMKTPVVMVRMMDDEAKTCPFLKENGCGVYSDRPWPCRMYPVGLATPGDGTGQEEFYFLLKEDVCHGHEEGQEWTVAEWMGDQGVDEYNEFGDLFKEVSLHSAILRGQELTPKQTENLFIACYDLDKFRRFLFETTFFEKFDVEPELIERLKTDDEELLRFGFRWIKYSTLKEKTMTLKDEVLKAKQQELSK